MTLSPPNTPSIADPRAEAVRRIHGDKITELQQLPMAGAFIVRDVSVPNAGEVMVAHALGRAPLAVLVSAPRGAGVTPGIVRDLGTSTGAGTPVDRARLVCLRGDGFGVAVTVDVVVI